MVCGSSASGWLHASMSKKRVPGIRRSTNSPAGSRPEPGRYQDPSRTTETGPSQVGAQPGTGDGGGGQGYSFAGVVRGGRHGSNCNLLMM